MIRFREDISYKHPDIIDDERKARILLKIYWAYQSNMTTISQEKLVYDDKDLLAWLGGAFGLCVGYSFYDFSKLITEFLFYCIDRFIISR